MYKTSAKMIVEKKKFFELNPTGKIPTGIWTDPEWDKQKFLSWFTRCLHLKTGGRELTDKDRDIMSDYRKVKDYKEKRIINRGRNIFRSKLFARIYPDLHNPTEDF